MVDQADILNLVAHFLKENNYTQTLYHLELEHGKPVQPQLLNSESLSQIVEDRLQFSSYYNKRKDPINVNEELPLRLKDLIHEQFVNWPSQYPQNPTKLNIHSLVISSTYDENNGSVYFSTNDSQVIISNSGTIKSIRFQEIVKKVLIVGVNIVLLGMSGKLYLLNENFEDIGTFDTQSRFTVDVKHVNFNGTDYIIVLTWSNMLKLVKLDDDISLVTELKLDQQGTCFDVTTYKNEIVIILGKLENTLLEVFTIQNERFSPKYKISINDAEFTTSSFSPRFITISHKGNGIPLIAVATSHEPYMRIIIISLIDFDSTSIARNQIIKNLNTLSPQDKFSQPLISWKLDSKEKESGIWVMGEDGIIRGLDIVDDKVVVELNQHQAKIKDFTSFINNNGDETLITSSIDRQTLEWK
ncbi:hypothetical protein CORT_0A06070 [Candida orthopsilosis Co 90-125]|uniref:Uncharacterized protein n=1 Tax=Candida orthopsilosis (strain 90-125) TaxID=1136231 RepID=H8WY47_CANO9|nr:hypothetical protein CORT_0A06070 [Candida orthopsilosis Co 90-125]CCG20994.1 hypothetical protein CORT_0A06070 [Candida orthopsilosis Co 90-125]